MKFNGFIVVMFLVVAAVLVHGQLSRPRSAHTARWDVEGFIIDMKWVKVGSADYALESMIAYPDGKMRVFLDGNDFTANREYNSARKAGCKVWIGVSTQYGYDVRPVEGAWSLAALRDYNRFVNSTFWKDCLRPKLIVESQRYDRWWFEKYGTQNRDSRFTSEETWKSWQAERESNN